MPLTRIKKNKEAIGMHIELDSNNKVFISVITFIIIAALTAFGSLLRPQIVLASDLKAVDGKIDQVLQQVQSNAQSIGEIQISVKNLAIADLLQRLDYVNDEIVKLEAKNRENRITNSESLRLSQLQNKRTTVERQLDTLLGR
jgi:hypothetical protein